MFICLRTKTKHPLLVLKGVNDYWTYFLNENTKATRPGPSSRVQGTPSWKFPTWASPSAPRSSVSDHLLAGLSRPSIPWWLPENSGKPKGTLKPHCGGCRALEATPTTHWIEPHGLRSSFKGPSAKRQIDSLYNHIVRAVEERLVPASPKRSGSMNGAESEHTMILWWTPDVSFSQWDSDPVWLVLKRRPRGSQHFVGTTNLRNTLLISSHSTTNSKH